MENNKINIQRTSAPKINGIDVLANARPIRMNPTQPQQNPAQQNLSQQNPAQQGIKTPPNNITELERIQQTQKKYEEARNAQFQRPIQQNVPLQSQATQPNIAQPNPQMAHSTRIEANNLKMPQNDDLGVAHAPHIINAEAASEAITPNNYANVVSNSSLVVDVEKLDFAITRRVRTYLKKLISVGGSDLHLKADSKIRARINGDIVVFSDDIFTKDDAITFAKEMTRTRFPEFAVNKEMDMTYIYDATTRFRVNLFFQMEGVSFAFRTIPTTQSTIDELKLPEAIHKIVDMERGLVLVTGITGSGKSTTLAAIINEINHKKAKHIITIEDPIEFVHKDAKSMLNQRSVGMDTNSFANALRAALREDPDIILVGEMRDIETIEMALHAAETGHLVLSTLHTLDAKETINRVISVFPTNDQPRIRTTLASTLSAIVSQRLLKANNGGRIAAIELLFKTPRIELIINEGRDGEILEALQEGKGIYSTQTFDQHLFELITDGIVDEEIALEKATSPSDLKLRLQNINFADKKDTMDTISIKS